MVSSVTLSVLDMIRILINDFFPHREHPKDPHIKWSNELHEPSTYFRHRSWCRDVYSTAEGKRENMFTNMQNALISNDGRKQTVPLLLSAVGKTSREHYDCLGLNQEESDESCSHQPSVWTSNVRGALRLLDYNQRQRLSAAQQRSSGRSRLYRIPVFQRSSSLL